MRIAVAVFEGAEELDFAGPWEVLAYWAANVATTPVEVVTVGPTTEPIRAAKGLRVLADHTLEDVGPLDVFLLPGGHGTRALLGPAGAALQSRLRAEHERGTLMTSVCTGSLVYAAAGLLAHRPATTYWDSFDELLALDPTIEARPADRYVDDGDIVTAAGVSAGIDMALHLVRRLDSETAARATRRGIQYDPQPPV